MMSVPVSPDDRSSILRYASWVLSEENRADPVQSAAAAVPLLEWAESAASEDDLRNRMHAMHQQYSNLGYPHGDPGRFVDEAGVLYAFLVAGQEDTRAADPAASARRR